MEGKPAEKRKGRTIDPKKITNIASWAKAFRRDYVNVAINSENQFVVLDPEASKENFGEALASPVKTIPHLYGSDYLSVLNDLHASEELRATAEEKASRIRTDINARVVAARIAFSNAEQDLLIAVDNWKSAADPATRTTTAMAVGAASRAVAEAEKELRESEYPRRYIRSYPDVTKGMINPGSGDKRMDYVIRALVPAVNEAADRVIGVVSPASH